MAKQIQLGNRSIKVGKVEYRDEKNFNQKYGNLKAGEKVGLSAFGIDNRGSLSGSKLYDIESISGHMIKLKGVSTPVANHMLHRFQPVGATFPTKEGSVKAVNKPAPKAVTSGGKAKSIRKGSKVEYVGPASDKFNKGQVYTVRMGGNRLSLDGVVGNYMPSHFSLVESVESGSRVKCINESSELFGQEFTVDHASHVIRLDEKPYEVYPASHFELV